LARTELATPVIPEALFLVIPAAAYLPAYYETVRRHFEEYVVKSDSSSEYVTFSDKPNPFS
jgi:hypothetical protein